MIIYRCDLCKRNLSDLFGVITIQSNCYTTPSARFDIVRNNKEFFNKTRLDFCSGKCLLTFLGLEDEL